MGCAGCLKVLLVGLNILVMVVGLACVAVGAWAYTTDVADIVDELAEANFNAGAIALMVAGACIVIVALLGICGALRKNRCCLGMYFIIMLILLVVLVIVAVLIVAYRNTIRDELENQMRKKIENNYGTDSAITDLVDKIQKEWKCCGVSGGLASADSWFIWQKSDWLNTAGGKLVPESCCKTTNNLAVCQNQNADSKVPPQNTKAKATAVSVANAELNAVGCIDEIYDDIESNLWAVGGIAIGAFVVVLFAVLAALYLCMTAANEDGKGAAA